MSANEVMELVRDDSEYSVIFGDYIDAFIQNNLGHIDIKEKIIETSEEIIQRFLCGKNYKVGLAVGQVQSGKTTNFLTTAALAFDNNFDLVIFLAGTTNMLVEQNTKRGKSNFPDKVCNIKYDKDVDESIYNLSTYVSHGLKSTMYILKHPNYISAAKELIKAVSAEYDLKVLVIDDEADYYSQNSKLYLEQETPIHKSIIELINVNDDIKYLAITASPQNILFKHSEYELYPDFVTLIKPGDEYCGLETFHKDDRYIQKVDSLDNDRITKKNENELKEALIYYMFTIYECLINSKYNNLKNWMLVHTSRLKGDHEDFKVFIDDFLNIEISVLNDKNGSGDQLYNLYSSLFENAFVKFGIENIFSYSFDGFLNDFDKVFSIVTKKEFIKKVNSDKKTIKTIDDDNYELQKDRFGIIVGGDIVGRGLTIEGLTVTYYQRDTNGNSAIDTVYQRARWFGYRNKILDFIKIFTTDNISKDFKAIYSHIESLSVEIADINSNGREFKDSRLVVEKDERLKHTGNTRNDDFYEYKASQNAMQSRIPMFDDYSSINEIREEFDKLFEKGNPIILSDCNMRNNVAINVKTADMLCLYRKISELYSFDKFENKLRDMLESILQPDLHSEVTLIFMRHNNENRTGNTAVREKDNIIKFNNYLVGEDKQDPANYKGDRVEYKSIEHIQVHYLLPKVEGNFISSGVVVPMLYVNSTKELKSMMGRR